MLGALAHNPATDVLCFALTLYVIALFIRILSSWFPISSTSPAAGFFSFLRRITEPVLAPARRLIPPIGGTFDISPIVVFFAIEIIQSWVLGCRTGIF